MRYAVDGRCVQDHFPGIGRYAFNLVRHLALEGPDDEFFVLYDPRAPNTRYDWGMLAAYPNIQLVEAPWGIFGLAQQLFLPRLLRRLGVALYHSPYYVAPYFISCPLIISIHDLIPLLHPEALPKPQLRHLFAGLIRLSLWRAECLLMDSLAAKEDLVRMAGVEDSRIAVIPLGVDDSFHPRGAKELTRLREHWGLYLPYVLYLGINKPHKNLVRLLQAWAELPAGVKGKYTLVLAGREDPRYPQVREAVQELELETQVRFLGAIDTQDVPLLYAGASAFVFPSLYEGFGLPVLEAMASGVPVACSQVSALPEVVGEAALLFDPYEVESIREALERLLTDSSLRQQLVNKGLERARQFSWRYTAAQTLQLYRRVIAEG